MASVFLCQDENLGRRVAVKRLHAGSTEGGAGRVEEVERRFAREARLGASLSHPNLVTVFDTATDGESVLIVMEYVDGESLAQALLRGPLEPRRAAALVRDVAGALDHAHGAGVVHRDVKPGNILIRADRVVKLVDLGIATAADLTQITRSGVLLGTAAYMAPEQLDGRSAGPAADIYALGTVAFEALSGRKARQGRTPMEVAHQVTTEPPPDLRDAWPRAPAAAADVLRRAMAPDPDDRPLSAGSLARDLEQALLASSKPPAPSPAPSAAPERRSASPSARRQVSPALVAAALALLLALGAGAIVLGSGGDGGEPAKKPLQAGKPKEPARTKTRSARSGEPRQGPAGAAAQTTPASPGQTTPAVPAGGDAVEGARLNVLGFDLFRQRRYREAIPILRRAVRSFPPGTTDVNYAYALYNLGASLRRAGRPDEAIPILERRLRIPNQTETVQAELDAARREARG
jgi:eukaryotic-like serine/threonine-protein kinase